MKNKEPKRSPRERGKRWYDFDFYLEKAIYDYLCCKRVKKKMLRKLEENLKFETYQQWKQYVIDKYQKLSDVELAEFSRFLNQEIRDMSPRQEYWSIMGTVFTTVIFTNMFSILLSTEIDFSGMPIGGVFLTVLVIEIVLVMCVLFFTVQVMNPIFNDNMTGGLLRDYKEIIDGIISEKNKEYGVIVK